LLDRHFRFAAVFIDDLFAAGRSEDGFQLRPSSNADRLVRLARAAQLRFCEIVDRAGHYT
jgi:hypothetical protein